MVTTSCPNCYRPRVGGVIDNTNHEFSYFVFTLILLCSTSSRGEVGRKVHCLSTKLLNWGRRWWSYNFRQRLRAMESLVVVYR